VVVACFYFIISRPSFRSTLSGTGLAPMAGLSWDSWPESLSVDFLYAWTSSQHYGLSSEFLCGSSGLQQCPIKSDRSCMTFYDLTSKINSVTSAVFYWLK
jgi:hypothetical protein